MESIDYELQSVPALHRAARERGGPLPSIVVADAVLDELLREFTSSDALAVAHYCPEYLTGASLHDRADGRP